MTSANPRPARLTSAGAILRRELAARGWTQRDLAEVIGRPAQAISEIVQGSKRITAETALELAAALGDVGRGVASSRRQPLAPAGGGPSGDGGGPPQSQEAWVRPVPWSMSARTRRATVRRASAGSHGLRRRPVP